MKKKIIGCVIIILIYICFSKIQKNNWAKEAPEIKHTEEREIEVWGKQLNGHSPELFYGTPLYDLAEEMTCFYWFRSEKKIEELIASIPQKDINFQDSKFQKTIGQFALTVSNLKAVRLLLDRGLNPNLIAEKSYGRALIIDINGGYNSRQPDGLLTLKYMIKKGANVNLYSKKSTSVTPLIEAACSGNFENVTVLIRAGADPNFIDKHRGDRFPFRSALSSALSYKRIKIVNYLIFDQKVDFRTLKFPEDSKFHPGEYEILYSLREMFFKLDSKEYQEKMKLVAYLKTQGLDYWTTPIPERFLGYGPKEYMDKY